MLIPIEAPFCSIELSTLLNPTRIYYQIRAYTINPEQIPRVIFKTFAENLSNILATVANGSRTKY